jgi:very-short-patch-repair endonuclease
MRSDLPNEGSSAHFKSERAVVAARRLRKSMAPAECALWVELRRLPLKGAHFRRQAPFGPFIRTSCVTRLIVEVDGGVHAAEVCASVSSARKD